MGDTRVTSNFKLQNFKRRMRADRVFRSPPTGPDDLRPAQIDLALLPSGPTRFVD